MVITKGKVLILLNENVDIQFSAHDAFLE